MDEAIRNHACFQKLFEVVPGSKRSIEITIQFDMATGELYSDYWSFSVFSKEKGNKMTHMFMSFCPFCGENIGPKEPHKTKVIDIPEKFEEN